MEKIIRPEEFDQQLQFGGKSKEEKIDLCDSIITQLDAELMQSFYEGKKSVRTFCKEYVHKTCPKPNFQFKNRKWEHKDDKFSHDELWHIFVLFFVFINNYFYACEFVSGFVRKRKLSCELGRLSKIPNQM